MVNKENTPNMLSDNTGSKDTSIESSITLEDLKNEGEINCQQTELEITGEKLLLSDIKEIPTLVSPFLQQTGIACLAGSSDTGKSTILRQLAISIVAGESDFLGFPINAIHQSVIYVATEDLEQETAFLLHLQTKKYPPQVFNKLRFIFDTTDLNKELDNRLTNKKADLVIIDCFSDCYGEDLKNSQQIRTYLHTFQELAQKHQCLFLFLHHTGKRTENLEPNKNNLLSGQGFEAKMRLVIELRADLLDPKFRHLCIVKGNYLPANYKKESYVLQFDEQNFHFSNTGDRMPFELLVKQAEGDSGKAKYEQAKELKDQGKTYDQIANAIGFSSKGSVSKLFGKAEKNNWVNDTGTVSKGNNGNK